MSLQTYEIINEPITNNFIMKTVFEKEKERKTIYINVDYLSFVQQRKQTFQKYAL